MKNKKGFTLIELMVVVVIIGILAAVAVPKLFGMIAKSKASEVGPAAGTYVKMQQAYVSEAVAVGGWDIIGYKAPGDGKTTNFTYTEGAGVTGANTIAIPTTLTTTWEAANNTKLNDCDANKNWTVGVAAATGSAGDVAFTSKVDNPGCPELTPNFKTIGN